MKTKFILLILLLITSCINPGSNPTEEAKAKTASIITTEDYKLIKPLSKINSLLILFGGFPETALEISKEFQIQELAIQNGIALMLMNFNKRLWLEENEKSRLTEIISKSIRLNNIPTTNIFIGGFSSGGNVSLLMANHLVKINSSIQPKGVFIIDSPVDLLELYQCSKRNIERNFSETSVRESERTVSLFDEYFGKPENGLEKYELYSPYLYSKNKINNLKFLKNLSIRLYTEPDTIWWKENRMNEYEDMNACYIKKLTTQLQEAFTPYKIELIETKNKGKRSNGLRHPHS